MITIFAITTLQRELGLWSVIPAFLLALTPQLALITAHRRTRRQTSATA